MLHSNKSYRGNQANPIEINLNNLDHSDLKSNEKSTIKTIFDKRFTGWTKKTSLLRSLTDQVLTL